MADNPGYYGGLIQNQISGGRAAFAPDYLRQALRRRALRGYFNQRRRGDVSARLLGLDPMQARAAAFGTEQAAAGNLTNALNESELADLQGNRDYLRSLLTGERGREFQAAEAEKERRSRRGTFGGFLGQAAGSLLPGIGSAIGGRLFGRRPSYGYGYGAAAGMRGGAEDYLNQPDFEGYYP